MPSFPRLLPLLVIILTSLFASCQANPAGNIRDLSAIHDPVTWQPVSNSAVEDSFQITDHRQLEEAILSSLGAISAEVFSFPFRIKFVDDGDVDPRREPGCQAPVISNTWHPCWWMDISLRREFLCGRQPVRN